MSTYTQHLQRPSLVGLAAQSCSRYGHLVSTHELHLRRGRLHKRYAAEDGSAYEVFRESYSEALPAAGPRSVLVVGFRLKLIRSSRVMHWLFQRVCILTTPFWSGFAGFGTKLWMVDDDKNYLGIYEWGEAALARRYVDALARVLRPLSCGGSVWYQLYPDTGLDIYLAKRESH